MRPPLVLLLVAVLPACGGPGASSLEDVTAWRARVLCGDAAAMETLFGAGARALPLLLTLLEDRDPNVVAGAASAVERLGAEAEPAIGRLLDAVRRFPDEPRHLSPLRELKAISVPHLVSALEGDDTALRAAAVEVISTFGPVAGPAVPALLGMLEQDEGEPRRKAAVALAGIGVGAEAGLARLDELARTTTGLEQKTYELSARRIRDASRPGPGAPVPPPEGAAGR